MEEGTKDEWRNGRKETGGKEAWRPETKEKGAGNRKQVARKEINSKRGK